jgi:hypothetical protein
VEIPDSKYARRIFSFIVVTTVALLLLIRFLLVPAVADAPRPSWSSGFDSVLSELTAAVLSGALITWVFLWLVRGTHAAAEVAIVPAYERGEVLDRAREGTESYRFSGGTGRYNRAVTLPDMARRAHSSNRSKEIVFQLLDPTNDPLCDEYASYRNRVRSGRGGTEWTRARVQSEVLATIVLCYAWARAR